MITSPESGAVYVAVITSSEFSSLRISVCLLQPEMNVSEFFPFMLKENGAFSDSMVETNQSLILFFISRYLSVSAVPGVVSVTLPPGVFVEHPASAAAARNAETTDTNKLCFDFIIPSILLQMSRQEFFRPRRDICIIIFFCSDRIRQAQ